MTDTNMTDTNTPHSGGGVPQDCGKRMRVTWHEENIVNRKAWALCGFVCAAAVGGVCGFVFAVQCLAQHQLCWVCWW